MNGECPRTIRTIFMYSKKHRDCPIRSNLSICLSLKLWRQLVFNEPCQYRQCNLSSFLCHLQSLLMSVEKNWIGECGGNVLVLPRAPIDLKPTLNQQLVNITGQSDNLHYFKTQYWVIIHHSWGGQKML